MSSHSPSEPSAPSLSDRTSAGTPVSRAAILTALFAVYIIWGSTFLGIRFAIESIPPLLMAGTRYCLAGLILFAWVRARESERPTMLHWRSAMIVGALLIVGGNGGVSWAEQYVASGLAALLISTVPLWVVVMQWAWPGGRRPSAALIAGVAVGLCGLALLIGPKEFLSGQRPHGIGTTVILVGSFCWSAGSLASRRLPMPRSVFLGIAMQMMCGGALLALVGLAFGEGARLDIAHVSMRSLLAFAYLVSFGSIIAFTCYVWLLSVTAPAKVATYAFVNPVVAVLLGAWLAAEPLTPRTLLAASVIVLAVAIITLVSRPRNTLA